MFNELLNNYKKRLTIEYIDENEEIKKTDLFIKPLSINDLMFIVDDEKCGSLLIKIIDGIDIKKNAEDVKEVVQRLIINPDYIRLFYVVLACCIFVKNGDKEYNLKHDVRLVELIPIEYQIQILNLILELSLPKNLKKFADNLGKLQARLMK